MAHTTHRPVGGEARAVLPRPRVLCAAHRSYEATTREEATTADEAATRTKPRPGGRRQGVRGSGPDVRGAHTPPRDGPCGCAKAAGNRRVLAPSAQAASPPRRSPRSTPSRRSFPPPPRRRRLKTPKGQGPTDAPQAVCGPQHTLPSQVNSKLTGCPTRGGLPKPYTAVGEEAGAIPARSRHCHRGIDTPGARNSHRRISSSQGADTLSEDISPCAAACCGSTRRVRVRRVRGFCLTWRRADPDACRSRLRVRRRRRPPR